MAYDWKSEERNGICPMLALSISPFKINVNEAGESGMPTLHMDENSDFFYLAISKNGKRIRYTGSVKAIMATLKQEDFRG